MAGNHVKVRSKGLENMKYEVADELGIDVNQYLGDLPSRECGRIGGNMVARLVKIAEEQLKNQGQQQHR